MSELDNIKKMNQEERKKKERFRHESVKKVLITNFPWILLVFRNHLLYAQLKNFKCQFTGEID